MANRIDTGINGPIDIQDPTQARLKKLQRQIQVEATLKEIEQEDEEGITAAKNIGITYEAMVPKAEISFERKNKLEICGLLFSVPINKETGNIIPASIIIDKQLINHKYQTLRTDSAFKSSSGHSTISIGMTLLFVGRQAINEGLRRLLAIFKSMPFFSIDNDFLRSNLVPANDDYVMACSLQDYTIRTVEGMPTTLAVDVRFLWFNYLPYATNFLYKRDWQSAVPTLSPEVTDRIRDMDIAALQQDLDVPTTDSLYRTITPNTSEQCDAFMLVAQPTKTASESKLVKERIEKEKEKLKTISFVSDVMEDQIILKYHIFAKIDALDPNNVPPDLPEPYGVVDVDTTHITRGQGEFSPDMRMKEEAADALEELAINYYHQTGTFIQVNSCFRSRMEQLELQRRKGKEIAAENSWHEVGLAVDINVATLSRDQWYTLLRVANAAGFSNLGSRFGFSPAFDSKGYPLAPVEATADPKYYKDEKTRALIQQSKGKIKTNWETWHFDFKGSPGRNGQDEYTKQHGGTTSAIRTLKQDQYRQHPKGSSGLERNNPDILAENRDAAQKSIDSHDAYIRGLMDQIDKLESSGFVLDTKVSTSSSLYFAKGKQFVISNRNPNVVPQNILVGRSNIIANIPIVGHEFATQQFLGSSDMDASIAFIIRGTSELKTMQQIFTEIQYNSREYRKVKNRSTLEIENNILNMCGFKYGIVESIRTETIDGMPDTYILRVNLTQFPVQENKTNDNLLDQSRLIPRYLWQTVAHTIWARFLSGGNISANLFMIEQQLMNIGGKRILYSGASKPTIRQLSFFAKDIETNDENADVMVYTGEAGTLAGTTKIIDEDTVWNSPQIKYLIATHFLPKDFKDKYITNRASQKTGSYKSGTAIGDILIEYYRILIRLMSIGGSSLHPVALGRLGISRETFPSLYSLIQDNRNKIVELSYKQTSLGTSEITFAVQLVKELQTLNNEILPLVINSTDPFLQAIASLAGDTLNKKWKGLPCYPDLSLPEHPILKSEYATPPDYWFYNFDIDGQIQKIDLMDKGVYLKRCTNSIDSYKKVSDQSNYDKTFISRNKPEIDKSVLRGKVGEEERKKNVCGAAMYPEDMLPITTKFEMGAEQIKNLKIMADRQKVADTTIKQKMHQQNTSQYENLDKVSFGQTGGDGTTDFGNIFKAVGSNPENIKDSLNVALANFNQQIYRLARAYPTFKITFIEEDETINPKNFDDFYSYSAIQDIRIVKSHKNPADLCIISLVNVHGELEDITFSNQQSKDFGGKPTSSEIIEKFDPTTINTNRENPFSKLTIVEGSRIKVKLGYSNDPDELTDEFNGIVVEVGTSPSSPDIVQLVCQGFGAELVAEEKNEGTFATTQELLSSMICSPEILNFGRWSRNQSYSPYEIRSMRSGGVNTSSFITRLVNEGKDIILNNYNFMNYPQDDNIFAPDLSAYTQFSEAILDTARNLFVGNLTDWLGLTKDDRLYKPYKSTVWDIFKEMELRHPGFVALPLNYGNRATIFFGPPYLSYWSRPASPLEQAANKRMNEIVNKLDPKRASSYSLWALAAFTIGTVATSAAIVLSAPISAPMILAGATLGAGTSLLTADTRLHSSMLDEKERLRLELIKLSRSSSITRLKPFRNYYILSSDHNIIANNIRVSSHGVFNAIQLTYMDKDPGVQGSENQDAAMKAIADKAQILEMKADDNILDKDIRVMQEIYPTCVGPYFARRYAVGLLMRSLRDMYKGEVVITGQPGIKPYDVCFLYDRYRDIYGPVEVEQVVQIFSKDTGWITEITPDLVVAHNNFTTMGTMEAMWEASNDISKNLFGVGGANTAIGLGLVAGITAELTGSLGLGLMAYGAYKFIQWTQCRQPVIITPLVQGYKPLIAGLNGYKRDGLIVNIRGKFHEFTEDVENGWNYIWNTGQISRYFQQRVADFSQ